MNRILMTMALWAFGVSVAMAQPDTQPRYPIPEGYSAYHWNTLKRSWTQRARRVEVSQKDGTWVAGLLLGAYPEGLALLKNEPLPFVAAEAMEVVLVPPAEISTVTVRPLQYSIKQPLLVGAGYASTTLALGLLEPSGTALALAVLGTPLVITSAAVVQSFQPYTHYFRMGEKNMDYAALQKKLDQFQQSPDWNTAQRIPETADVEPGNPETFASLYTTMPAVQKAFRPKRLALSYSYQFPLYSGAEVGLSQVSVAPASNSQYTRKGGEHQFTFRGQISPRVELGLLYSGSSAFSRARYETFNGDTLVTATRFLQQLQWHTIALSSGVRIIRPDDFLRQRHGLTATLGVGLTVGTERASLISFRFVGQEFVPQPRESTKFSQPTGFLQLEYSYALTRSFSLQANVTGVWVGQMAIPDRSLEYGNEIYEVTGATLDLSSVSAGLGMAWHF